MAGIFGLAVIASLYLTLGLELQNSPDAKLYTSGFSFFPSPLGTILGTLFGVEGLAVLQALTIGAVAVALVAGHGLSSMLRTGRVMLTERPPGNLAALDGVVLAAAIYFPLIRLVL